MGAEKQNHISYRDLTVLYKKNSVFFQNLSRSQRKNFESTLLFSLHRFYKHCVFKEVGISSRQQFSAEIGRDSVLTYFAINGTSCVRTCFGVDSVDVTSNFYDKGCNIELRTFGTLSFSKAL